ncbi:MAG: hypothetical protein PVI21_01615 [Candidatus Woesebacteria bacterium]|jgi:hypothetical protein
MNNNASLDELKSRFYKVYANVPLNLRNEIVTVLDKEPVSWSAAYIEIETNSARAEQILTELEKLSII